MTSAQRPVVPGQGRASRGLGVGFASMGATGAIFGPALPALADSTGASVSAASQAVVALFGGLLVAVLLLQMPYRFSTAATSTLRRVGGLLQAVGLLGVPAAPSIPLLLTAAAVAGLGFGFAEASLSTDAASGALGASRLSLLGATFALAAILTPVVVALSLHLTGSVWAAFAAATGLQALGVAMVPPGGTGASAPARYPSRPRRSRTRSGALLGAVLVLYVGAEVLLSTWITDLSHQLIAAEAATAPLAATMFWTLLAVGRLAGARLARHEDARNLLRRLLWFACAALILGTGFARLSAPLAGWYALGLIGLATFALGPVYGFALAQRDRSGAEPSLPVVSRRIAVGAVGGATVPFGASMLPTTTTAPSILLLAALLSAAAAFVAGRLER